MSGRPEVAGHSQSARSALTVRFGSFLSCLAVHKMHSQQSASAPEGGWLPGARPASAASRLFGQRPGAYPVGAGQGEPGRVAAERQQRNLVQPESGPSFPNENEGCARRRRGPWRVQSHSTPGTSVRRVFLRGTRRLVNCQALSWRGAYSPTHVRRRGMLCRAGLDIMGNQYASVAKSTMIVVVIASCCIGAVFHRDK